VNSHLFSTDFADKKHGNLLLRATAHGSVSLCNT
jgi:hypothetical protein